MRYSLWSHHGLVVFAARRAAFLDRQTRADAALRGGKASAALKVSLENPPFSSKDQALKDSNFALVQKALLALSQKEAEVSGFLEQVGWKLRSRIMLNQRCCIMLECLGVSRRGRCSHEVRVSRTSET